MGFDACDVEVIVPDAAGAGSPGFGSRPVVSLYPAPASFIATAGTFGTAKPM